VFEAVLGGYRNFWITRQQCKFRCPSQFYDSNDNSRVLFWECETLWTAVQISEGRGRLRLQPPFKEYVRLFSTILTLRFCSTCQSYTTEVIEGAFWLVLVSYWIACSWAPHRAVQSQTDWKVWRDDRVSVIRHVTSYHRDLTAALPLTKSFKFNNNCPGLTALVA